jgi:cysteine desulfurase/selenocysteine lyase
MGKGMLTTENWKRDFPSLEGKVYLNSAAESIPPVCVHEALEKYWRDKSLGMKGRDHHFAELEECRGVAADLLGKKPGEVAFCSCSSEAYNLLSTALQLGGGDEVVVSDLDFPAGATPWIRSPKGLGVRLWKNQGGVLEVTDLLPLLSKRTKLVQVSLVSFLTGYRIPWAAFKQAVREHAPNAILAVDVTQAFGRVELDCLGDADCIISSTHKWILGIHGGCVVAIPERSAERLTTYAGGWFHIRNAFDADRFEKVVPKAGAESFGVGMPNFPAIYALKAGMSYIQKIGEANIAAHADPIVAHLHSKLESLGLRTMSPAQLDCPSGIVSFQHPRDGEIQADLLAKDIHVMHQAGRLRISVHGYNRMEDIDALAGVLEKWA